jgi:ABC-type antimicrobial peptide transport system permease subunit
VAFTWWGVSYNFVQTVKLNLREGRDFSPVIGTDTLNVLINEEAAKVMGLKHPLDQFITIQRETRYTGKIIGVVKNFHFHSLHTPIQPLILFLDPKPLWGNTIVRIKPGKTLEAMAAIGQAHRKYNPAFPLEYQFADQDYDKLYQTERLAGQLAAVFAGLAIVVSCLGLLGLAFFMAEQRTKEIGIRKVLGATVGGIVGLLTLDLLKPVGLALLTALPLAWYLLEQWLEDFAYKITIEWWMFAVMATLTLLVALLTVGFQSIKAALANPVQSLRTE